VNTFISSVNKVHFFTGPVLGKLRIAVVLLGPDEVGFTTKQIVLHSTCSGAAMAMYLAGVPVFTIMLLGFWSSDAFL
jgi:hypothetical protein